MRLAITTIVLALLPASWGLALTSTTVSFQNGINGYTGAFDRYINDGTGDPLAPNTFVSQTNGSAVETIILNGYNAGSGSPPAAGQPCPCRTLSTPDAQGLIRFDNLFTNTGGPIPVGAFILDAQLQFVTTGGSTTDAIGQSVVSGINAPSTVASHTITGSEGPFGVSALKVPFSSTTDYHASFPNPGDPFGSRGPYYTANNGAYATRPVGTFGTAGVGQIVSAPVMSAVQQWSNGTLANNGFAIQAGFDGVSDDWHIHTTGYSTPEGRPKLTITYTTDPVTLKTFQPGVGGYAEGSVTMARVVGTSPTIPTPITTNGATITDSGVLDGLDSSTAEQLALVKFSNVFGAAAGQAPADKPVARAWLVLTTSAGANSRTRDPYDVDVMKIGWNTGTLYNQFGANPGLQFADGDTTPALARLSGLANGSEAWYDITNYLEAVRSGALTDNGLAIRARGADGWTILFNGNTDTALRPRLVVASQTTPVVPSNGDFNNDAVVDARDYVVWRKGIVPTTPQNYSLWRANYGSTPTPVSSPTVLMNYDLLGLQATSTLTTWDPNTVQTSGTTMVQNSSQSAPGVTGLPLSRGPGVGNAGLSNGWSAQGWTNVNDGVGNPVTKTNAIATGEYLQFGITIDASHKASLSTLEFPLRRSALNAPMNFALFASIDGFTTPGTQIGADFTYLGRISGNAPEPNPILSDPDRYMTLDSAGRPNATLSPGDQITTFNLSTFAFLQNLTNKGVTFRLFAWGDGSSMAANSNTVAFGRVNGPLIKGLIVPFPGAGSSLVAVPEPSIVPMMGMIAIALGIVGRRRRQAEPALILKSLPTFDYPTIPMQSMCDIQS